MTDPAHPADDGRMTLFEHLAELRTRLIKCVLAVAIGAAVAWMAYPWISDFLLHPYEQLVSDSDIDSVTQGRLLQTDPLEGFSIRLKISLYGGIALAMPVILWQVWRFITPGLYPRERRYAAPFVISSVFLFVLGALIAYWTLPKALDFLVSIGGDNFVTAFQAQKYFQLIAYMMLAFGIGFEFPVLLVALQLLGLLSTDMLRRWRRQAIVVICIIVAIATPSADPISMLALSVPMVVFYEVSILIGRVASRRRAARAVPAPTT